MKQFFLIGLLAMALTGLASGQGSINTGTNNTAYNAPPSPIPQIDNTNFVNSGPLNLELPGTGQFDFSDVLTFTNTSSMFSTTGFIFDTAPASAGQRHAAMTFGNRGVVAAGSFTNIFTSGLIFYEGFVGAEGLGDDLPELDISATNVVNTGTLSVGMTGIMKVGGNHVDLSRGTLHVEGFDDVTATGLLAGGITNIISILPVTFNPLAIGIFNVLQGIGLETNALSIFGNFTLPNAESPVNLVNNVVGLQTADIVAPPNATPFVFQTMINQSNAAYQVVFINTNLPGVSTDVRFQPSGLLTTPVIQWASVVTNGVAGSLSTNFLYLSDEFGVRQTNFLVTNGFTLSGVAQLAPFNFTFNRSFVNYTNLLTKNVANYDANIIFGGAFPATNAYAAYEVNVQPASFIPDGTAAIASVTNLPGRIEISATNWLDLTRTKITGPNYISVMASNHFVGSANAQITAAVMDVNVGSTNGLLTITNLVATSVPRLTGLIDMWSGRWTNVVTTTINGTNTFFTNFYHVLIVNSGLAPAAPSIVLNFAARSTNTATHVGGNVVISDILNISNSLSIRAQSLTLTTNDTSSLNSTGEINLLTPAIGWSTSLPILQNLTNWGVIDVPANADFVGNRHPPDFTTSFMEPYLSFVNHGLVVTEGTTVSANYVENTSFGAGIFQLGTVNFTNNAFGALLYAADGPIVVQAGTALLTNDTVLAANGDLTVSANNLTVINHSFQTSGSLTLSVSNNATDGGAASSNFWVAAQGFNLLAKPTTGDFLGTTVTLTSPAGQEVFDTWAGLDLGPSPAGFANNGALGHLILDGGDSLSQFFFGGLDTTVNYALYVDQIELRNGATTRATGNGGQNFTAFDLAPNFKIYYADAVISGNDISEKLQQGNNHQLIWVPAFAGIFSSTNFVSNGQTNTFNRALVQSTVIDSNGNGTANAFDPNPIFTANSLNFSLIITNAPTNSATKIASISWAGLANSTNYLFYRSNLTSTNWVQVFSTNQGPSNGTITVKRTNSAGFYRVQVNPSQP